MNVNSVEGSLRAEVLVVPEGGIEGGDGLVGRSLSASMWLRAASWSAVKKKGNGPARSEPLKSTQRSRTSGISMKMELSAFWLR
jgi:hypothetical protein